MAEQKSNLGILDWLLERQERIDTAGLESVAVWKKAFDAAASGWDTPADRAVIGGFLADRTAYAFAAGYESGLRRLVPSLPEKAIVALCVTEDKGGHPSSIKSTLHKPADGQGRAWALNGSKKFITMANEAELLLVAASTGTSSDGKNQLRLALVDRAASGVEVTVMTGLPFLPEISHGTVAFRDVPVADENILPGDGYAGYIRPFRTIEDLHVFAAIAGFIFRIACLYRWPRAVKEQITGLIVWARALALDNPSAPAVHIALGGLHRQIAAMLEGTSNYWELVDEKTRAGWERDRALLKVAENVRSRRLETAWSRFG